MEGRSTADAAVPEHDGTIGTARLAADAYSRRAKADNTRRAYRAGVRAWCAWCASHELPYLPAHAAERGSGLSVNTVELRRAAIRSLHFIAGLPVPTAVAHVAATLAGIHRAAADAGELPAKKLAATADILRQILAGIPDDLAGLRDRALLLVRQRRHRGHPVRRHRTLPGAGAVFRRIFVPPTRHQPGEGLRPSPVVGTRAIDAGTVARIIKTRAAKAGFDPDEVGGRSLKRGALTTGMDRGVHPTRLKQFGRHKSYAVLDEYLELGDPFDGHPLNGVL